MELKKLLAYENDEAVLERLLESKKKNKHQLAKYLKETQGIKLNEESIYDIPVSYTHLSIVEVRLIGPDVIFIEKYRFARWGSETDLKFIGKIFPKLDI